MGRGSAGQGDLPPAAGGGRKPTIAVFNSSDDTVELLRTALEAEGFQTVVGHIPDVKKGEIDLIDFINHHTPAVIVYDISPPYDANWTFLRLVRSAASGETSVSATMASGCSANRRTTSTWLWPPPTSRMRFARGFIRP